MEQIDRQVHALAQGQDAALPAAIERLEQIEQVVQSLAERHESSLPAATERLDQIERRLDAVAQGNEASLPAAMGRIDQLEIHLDALAQGQNPLPAALSRLDGLEARLDVLLQTSGGSGSEQGVLQLLKQGSVGVAMASVNELHKRVDQLYGQEEALSRIVNLIVARGELIKEDDVQRERPQGPLRNRREPD